MKKVKKYIIDNKELMKEWDWEKNKDLDPHKITYGSTKRAWWKCNACGNEWQSIISNRANLHRGCSVCAKTKMKKNRHNTLLQLKGSLADNYPNIAAEWHPYKNGKLLPSEVTSGSIKKVWWKCNVCGNEWQATVGNRTNRKSGCPFCSMRKVIEGKTDLQTKNPGIAKEWNYEKNCDLKPTEVSVSSNIKVWWKCNVCGYEWNAKVGNRTNLGRGCPKCGKLLQKNTYREEHISKVGSLVDTNPKLAKEWHPTRNGSMTPETVSAGCSDKAWWLLPYDDPNTGKHFDFEWKASIASRNSGIGCPFLSGKCWPGFNDLTTTNHEILKYWDYSKNKRKPELYTKGNHEKVWWICDYGHSFKSSVAAQCRKYSCPVCNKEKQTSFPEQAIYFYIRQILPEAINGDKTALDGLELDIFIPSKKIGIEYDGYAWHKNTDKDINKDTICKQKGIKLIRVREEGCKTYKNDSTLVYYYKYSDWQALDKIIKEICSYLTSKCIDISIERDINKIEEMYFTDKRNNSAAVSNPELLSIWHPTKNAGLTLYQFNHGSEKIAWWQDSLGHEYKCRINVMTREGEHCPYCSNRKLLVGFNDLQTKFPDIAAEWNYEKNEGIKPSEVRYNKGKFWFKCGTCGNEWQAYLENRTRDNNPTGCPVCGNRRAINAKMKNNILSEKYPELVSEWNYERNGNLKPSDVTANSKLRVWWKCSYGHEWETSILHRTYRKSSCPTCQSIKHSRAVINIDTGIVYKSEKMAAKDVGLLGTGGITMCCQGKQKTAGGYHWKYYVEKEV